MEVWLLLAENENHAESWVQEICKLCWKQEEQGAEERDEGGGTDVSRKEIEVGDNSDIGFV